MRTLMITGDHARTARAIARELGIADGEGGDGGTVLRGRELAGLGDEELTRAVSRGRVFARVDPESKLRIVSCLREAGEVVAMTGDEVNDARALKEADIGVAMGRSGTDAAREAGDMVLADDDCSTMVAAIREGRRTYDNIRSFVRYLLNSNAGELLTIAAAIAAAGPLGLGEAGSLFLPLLAVQILWINLVSDGPPALALGVDRADAGLMRRPPRPPDEPIVDGPMWLTIGTVGAVMMAGTLGVLDAHLPGGLWEARGAGGDEAQAHARTVAFTTLVLFQLLNVFNCRSDTRSIFAGGLGSNSWLLLAVAGSLLAHVAVLYVAPLQRAFETRPLAAGDWLLAVAVTSTVVAIAELQKALRRRRLGNV